MNELLKQLIEINELEKQFAKVLGDRVLVRLTPLAFTSKRGLYLLRPTTKVVKIRYPNSRKGEGNLATATRISVKNGIEIIHLRRNRKKQPITRQTVVIFRNSRIFFRKTWEKL